MAQNKNQGGGKMTVEEAGRKGGEATRNEHGPEFYSEIGRKGGESVSQDRQHMSDIGRKGGEARSDDSDIQSGETGRKGGEARSQDR